jgi:hypothetical protein
MTERTAPTAPSERGTRLGGGGVFLLLLLAFGAGALFAGFARWLRAPAPVPDHAAPFVATKPMVFAAGNALSQRLRAERAGLRAVDVILAAEAPGLPGEVEVRLAEWPSGQEVRVSRLPAAAVPAGEPWRFRPGQPDEQWSSFGFDPLPDSAGRDYVLTLSYPLGRDVPGERLLALAHLPGKYPGGDLAVNGDALSGNLLFRLAGSGTRGEALQQAGDNLAREQPYFPASLALPAILALLAAGLAAALAVAVLRRAPEGGRAT